MDMTMLDSPRSETAVADAPARTPWRAELAALLTLGLPMGLTQLVQFSINTVDVLMIGRLGPEPLAASALGLVMFYLFFMVALGPAMALSPLISQRLGADPDDVGDVRRTLRMGLWIAALLLPFSVTVAYFSDDIARLLGQSEALAMRARPYVLALSPGLPFMIGVVMMRNFLAAIERTRWPLAFIVVTTLLNAGLNWLLIYGNLGFPRLELVGAGIASTISHAAGFVLLAAYARFDARAARFRVFDGFLAPAWSRFREILTLGAPIGVSIAFEALLFNACVFLMGRIGVDEVAAYQVALNVAALAFMLPLGLAMAGCVRVGLHKGAGDLAGVRRAAALTILVAAAMMVAFWAPAIISPAFIAGLYLDPNAPGNARVIALVISFLPVAAAFGLFDAVQVGAMNGLRGLKDVRLPMLLTGVSYWAIGFPIAAWLGLGTSMGAVGVWWGLLAALFAAALSLTTRLWFLVR
jgi:MATE family multidrug resistance protein